MIERINALAYLLCARQHIMYLISITVLNIPNNLKVFYTHTQTQCHKMYNVIKIL